MKRWKITVEYDGTPFCGWQKQKHDLGVQEVIEEAIEKFAQERPDLYVAGRTDAGVHARAQVAHFDLEKDMDADTIQGALNYHVGKHPISILKVEEAHPEFHARFNALGRSYRYLISNRRAPLAIDKNRMWHVARSLDVNAMNDAASLLLGNHDFSTFRAHHCQAKSPIKTLDLCDVSREGEIITFKVEARSFLYHQVRNIVGTLSLVGSGQWTLDQFQEAFEACDRTKGGPTAPPEGLYFWEVFYK